MPADWETEIGAGAPIIDADWAGFVDLRSEPGKVELLPETRLLPGLEEVLLCIHSNSSQVWTSKCDVWEIASLSEIGFDRFDLDAPESDCASVVGCYIDLLPRIESLWTTPAQAECAAEQFCDKFNACLLKCCRLDLVVREALLADSAGTFGITAYTTACGADSHAASSSLLVALRTLAARVVSTGNEQKDQSRLE